MAVIPTGSKRRTGSSKRAQDFGRDIRIFAPVWLADGDEVAVDIAGIGVLVNQVRAD